MSKICVLGKDERSEFLRKKYVRENIELGHYSNSDFIIAPIPFTRDNYYINNEDIKVDEIIFSLKKKKDSILITGGLNEESIQKLKVNNIKFYDIMESESFVEKNANATAEGTIKIIMENTIKTIQDLNIMIIGYGRIGKKLTSLLKAFNSNIIVVTRREEVKEKLTKENITTELTKNIYDVVSRVDVIINTAPAIFLKDKVLENIKKETLIIDVASKPGGVDFIKAEKLGLRVLWELGIPSKYSPDSAASFIKEEVDRIMKNK